MPVPNYAKPNNVESINSTDNSDNHEPQEDMYTQILRNYEEYANMKGSKDEINQTNVTDAENPAGYVIPASDYRIKNAVMNAFWYRHWHKWDRDMPPRSEHWDM